MNMSIYIPFRGTRLTEQMREMGYITDNTVIGDETSSTVKLVGDMTREELEGLHRTFNLYCKVPKKMFPLLNACEKDNETSRFVLKHMKRIYMPREKNN